MYAFFDFSMVTSFEFITSQWNLLLCIYQRVVYSCQIHFSLKKVYVSVDELTLSLTVNLLCL